MKKLHSKDKGTLGEIAVAKYMMQRGLPVFAELGDNCKVDLIVLKNDVPIKIQVKTYSKERDGSVVRVYAVKSGPNYRYRYVVTDFDVMAVYLHETDEILFVFLREILEHGEAMTIRLVDAKNGQSKGVKHADNYRSFNKAIKRSRGV